MTPAVEDGDSERPVQARRVRGAARVRFGVVRIRLSEDQIRRGIGALGQGVPDQHPVVPGIGDEQPTLVHPDPGRQVQPTRRAAPTGSRALGVLVGLAQHDVCRGAVVVWQVVPDEHPVVSGVGGDDLHAVGPDRPGAVHPRGGRCGRWQQQAAGRVRAQHAPRSPPRRWGRRPGGGYRVRAQVGPGEHPDSHGDSTQIRPSSTRTGTDWSLAPGIDRHSPSAAS